MSFHKTKGRKIEITYWYLCFAFGIQENIVSNFAYFFAFSNQGLEDKFFPLKLNNAMVKLKLMSLD